MKEERNKFLMFSLSTILNQSKNAEKSAKLKALTLIKSLKVFSQSALKMQSGHTL